MDESTAVSTTGAATSASARFPAPERRAERNRGATLRDIEAEPWQMTPDVEAAILTVQPKTDQPRSHEALELARAFLEAYADFGQIAEAAAAVNISTGTANYYKQALPGFRGAFDFIEQHVNARWRSAYEHLGAEGYAERYYTADGKLKGSKLRQDPSTWHRIMAARMPEEFGQDRGGGVSVTVVVNDVREGR